MKTRWTRVHTAIVLTLIVILFLAALKQPSWAPGMPTDGLALSLVINIVIFALIMITVGHGVNGRLAGVFIDSRNRMSLSRFQMVIWSMLVIAAIWSALAWNVAESPDHTAGEFKNFPEQLFLVLGLASFTGIASPILLSQKRSKDPDPDQYAAQLANLQKAGTDTGRIGNDGMVVTKASPADASWADLFQGDETGNLSSPDVGKLQNFLFTLILVATYAGALFEAFAKARPGAVAPDFPPFSETMTIFLTISHAAYLSTKIVPNSSAAPAPGA
jgi:hypothetical protein